MIIKNYSQLVYDDLTEPSKTLRKTALEALEKAIEAVKPKKLVEKAVKVDKETFIIKKEKYTLTKYNKVLIIGGGKATAQMALTLEDIFTKNFPDLAYEGIINVPEGLVLDYQNKPKNITINYASHPIPNEQGLKGVKKMIKLIKNSHKNDLIIALISGGGSALLPLPRKSVSLEELKTVNSLLLESGANIHEINAVRKHLSNFKGGNLARKIYKSSGATLVSLIISDVIGNDLDSIASGPTVPDSTTYSYAFEIINKYNLLNKIPNSAKKILEKGKDDPDLENPKAKDPCFENVYNYLIGSVDVAVGAIQEYLSQKNFNAVYFSDKISGEARDYADKLYDIIKNKVKENEEIGQIALIGSGELTVTIRGEGIGGRNQELLIALLKKIRKNNLSPNILVLGANLDGIEGNSKAMGALIDNDIIGKAKNIDLEKYLQNNDSNSFFKKMGAEIITGQTGCNVNDVILALLKNNL